MIDFLWSNHEDGYFWKEMRGVNNESPNLVDNSTGTYLMAKQPLKPLIYYNPLNDKPTLFEEFANLLKDDGSLLIDQSDYENENRFKAKCLEFANKYGWLGLNTLVTEIDNEERYTNQIGERFDTWLDEAKDMFMVNQLWVHLSKGHSGFLDDLVLWEKDLETNIIMKSLEQNAQVYRERKRNLVRVSFLYRAKSRDSIETLREKRLIGEAITFENVQLMPFKFSDSKGAATYLILNIINSKIQGTVSPQLIYGPMWELKPIFVPNNLLSAMWLQLYQAVSGLKNFTRCVICEGLIERNEKSRSTKKAHTKCANRANMQVSRKIEKLLDEGQSVEYIFNEVKGIRTLSQITEDRIVEIARKKGLQPSLQRTK